MQRYVGTDLARPEGPAKVSGRALYVADLAVPGAWIGGTVRSDVAHGELLGFTFDPRFDFDRIVGVRPADIPGDNVIALITDDQPLLAAHEVRHIGEPLMLIAAPDRATLLEALAAIHPRIESREPVFDMEKSTHVLKSLSIDKGDVDHAFAHPPRGARVFEGTYRTGTQEQLYIEPQGCIAWPRDPDGTVLVKGSLQCPFYIRKALARALAIAPEKARVVQMETGGGFGGKEEYPSVVACHAALLAEKVGKPVKLIYERHEDLAFTPKRHPSRVRHKTLVASDGTLLAMEIDVLMDGGAYTTLSPVVLSRGSIHAAGPYRCDHVRIQGRVVATNHVPYGAFRGFGAPQTCFAIERQMDRIAAGIDMHPAELRQKNALRLGDTTATSQVLSESVGSKEVLERMFSKTGFDKHDWRGTRAPSPRHDYASGEQSPLASRAAVMSAPRVARGLGLSFFFHGAGFTGSGETMLQGRVRVSLLPDGRVEVLAASTEIGQGTNAMFLAIASEALGTGVDDVVLATPDTARVPDSGPTVASRTCMIVGGCLQRACQELVQRIGGDVGSSHQASKPLPIAREGFRDCAREFLARGGDGSVTVTYTPPRDLAWDDATYTGDAYPVYGWAADVASVEVDLDTFEVRVLKLWTAVDVGKAIQPKLVEGQIEGGTAQALGFAHLEVVTTKDGRFQQDRLATCIIPTSLDVPPIEVDLVEIPYSRGPYGAKGVGELPMDGGAPAILSAIEDALGIHIDSIPATPELLCAAWLALHPEECL